mmetsp:Transcript_6650/g.22898  ORF Transcript_6650/g.22898 Transcript_6650/m.22898 type:complete len:375 (-) Transcript_6650:342-1466(-)
MLTKNRFGVRSHGLVRGVGSEGQEPRRDPPLAPDRDTRPVKVQRGVGPHARPGLDDPLHRDVVQDPPFAGHSGSSPQPGPPQVLRVVPSRVVVPREEGLDAPVLPEQAQDLVVIPGQAQGAAPEADGSRGDGHVGEDHDSLPEPVALLELAPKPVGLVAAQRAAQRVEPAVEPFKVTGALQLQRSRAARLPLSPQHRHRLLPPRACRVRGNLVGVQHDELEPCPRPERVVWGLETQGPQKVGPGWSNEGLHVVVAQNEVRAEAIEAEEDLAQRAGGVPAEIGLPARPIDVVAQHNHVRDVTPDPGLTRRPKHPKRVSVMAPGADAVPIRPIRVLQIRYEADGHDGLLGLDPCENRSAGPFSPRRADDAVLLPQP